MMEIVDLCMASGHLVAGHSQLGHDRSLPCYSHFAGGPELTFVRALSFCRNCQLIKLMWLGLSGTRATLPDWQLPQFLLH